MESKERSESGGIRFHRYTMKKNTGSIAIPFLITLLRCCFRLPEKILL